MRELEERIGYSFRNRELLINALTHSSYAREHNLAYRCNNERLEFIGDAYLDAVIGRRLYDLMSNVEEGVLSKRRAAAVCEASLADVARDIKLGSYIRLGRGEATNNGADKDSILSDALEALFGAVIIDGGFEEGSRVVTKLLDEKIRLTVEGNLIKDYKTELQEKLQSIFHNSTSISYVVIDESGPAHDRTFTMEVRANGKLLGTGRGKSKLKAEQKAAADAIAKGVTSVF